MIKSEIGEICINQSLVAVRWDEPGAPLFEFKGGAILFLFSLIYFPSLIFNAGWPNVTPLNVSHFDMMNDNATFFSS